ncbi:uncharacterized protein LOC122502062 [Leptopilina heterotoma]|uniref:uncharacterized protein LOC122502062 n=1 Tax=Leptopilina heterotoma TaxID=63436 RepID=UPI001CA94960|nr:uncharacterized protein LOC122502062 [Leptopilina heterotoma]
MPGRIIFFCLITATVSNSELLVKTKNGIVDGTFQQSRNGRNYSAFLGIPYGKAPVGDLRFKNPQPAEKWSGIRQAKSFGSSCLHTLFGIKTIGKEDCLFLNVYSPLLEFQENMKNNSLPVMVYLHGGIFFFGGSDNYEATYFLDKNVIFVTLNYRQGILGFLTTADSEASGNFGLKDQRLALKWVQENIESFGGDKNRVTLFGISSGSSSVHYHTLSKASDGLFHQYILQSGTALSNWAYRDSSKIFQTVKKIANFVSCPTKSTKILMNCLRKTDANDLLFWSNIVGLFVRNAELAWVPTNESPDSEETFLTDNPENLMEQMKDLPFISGVSKNEGLFFISAIHTLDLVYNLIKKFLKKLIIDDAVYLRNSEKTFSTDVYKFYFNNSQPLDKKTQLLDTYTTILSDGMFIYPQIKVLDQITPKMKNPTYFYNYGYRGDVPNLSNFLSNDNFGVGHGNEIIFLFPFEYFIIKRTDADFSPTDRKISKLFVDLWTSFAANGKPTSDYLEPPNIWKPYNTENNSYLQIGDEIDNMKPSVKLSSNFSTERMNFWREHFPSNIPNKMENQLIILLFYLIFAPVLNSKLLVETLQGKLLGTVEKSRSGRNYSAFLGVPYGQPPIGILRFKNPVPAKKWSGIRTATSLGNSCLHSLFGLPFGNEDCLFLNIYSPFLEFHQMNLNTSKENPLPVMVFIHGGAFFFGAGNDYKANYIMDKNVIFVTINYRLGIFGFLSTADLTAPGNFGMKDQVLALKWIQKNIKFFGGDPNRVTIFGQSAGSASVHLHTLSEASSGLFHQFILQSGTALTAYAYRDRNEIFGTVKKIANFVNCSTTSTKVLLNCLQKKNEYYLLFWSNLVGILIRVAEFSFEPTNEPINNDAFLIDNPQNLMHLMKDVPFICGVTGNEAVAFTNFFYTIDLLYNLLSKFMKKIFINDAVYIRNDKKSFPSEIDEFYFNNNSDHMSKKQNVDIFTNILTDGLYNYPAMRLLDQIAPRMKSSNYFYQFVYHGDTSLFSNFLSNENFGVGHADELLFLFPFSYFIIHKTDADLSDNDRIMSKLTVDLWTSFAINGKPTSEYLNPPNLWKPFNTEKNPFLQIGDENDTMKPSVKLSSNFLAERMNFWRKNFPPVN